MTRNFGLTSAPAPTGNRQPARSLAADTHRNSNSLAAPLPPESWPDLMLLFHEHPFIQTLIDLALIGIGALLACAVFTAIGLLGYVVRLYLSS
jgi:hypothetical protein